MKTPKLLFALLILFVLFQVCLAQKEKSKTELTDSFGAVPCDEILARLDNFLVTIRDEPGAVGYVIFYGGLNPIQNSFYEHTIRNHSRMRRFPENQFKVVTTNPLQEFKVELWLGRNGEKPVVEERKSSLVLNRIASRRYLFAEDSVAVVRIDGRLTYIIGSCAACCIETINPHLLSKFLKANPEMRADIRVYNNKRSRANQFIKLFLNDVKENYQIPRNRLKIGYAGIDKGAAEPSENISTVKIWLVPEGRRK